MRNHPGVRPYFDCLLLIFESNFNREFEDHLGRVYGEERGYPIQGSYMGAFLFRLLLLIFESNFNRGFEDYLGRVYGEERGNHIQEPYMGAFLFRLLAVNV